MDRPEVEDWTAGAEKILEMCKTVDVGFWSRNKFPEMKNAWGRVFRASGKSFKAIQAGVEHFYAHDTTGDRPTPGKLIHHAELSRQEWLNTPRGRAWAEANRLERQEARDKALAEGTWTPKGS